MRLQTHKLSMRREIFKDLTDLLETQELGEKVATGKWNEGLRYELTVLNPKY